MHEIVTSLGRQAIITETQNLRMDLEKHGRGLTDVNGDKLGSTGWS